MTNQYGIIACSKSKKGENNPNQKYKAEELYDSWLFDGRVAAVKAHCEDWCIMSAKHGHLNPTDKLSWYDKAITELDYEERVERAHDVTENLPPACGKVMILMGRKYFKPLQEALPDHIEIYDPLEGVQLFDQRSKLKELANTHNQQTLENF